MTISKNYLVAGLVLSFAYCAEATELCSFRHHHNASMVRSGVDQRPAATKRVQSSALPIVVHYPDDVLDEYAREVLIEAEYSWGRLVGVFGFYPPHPDDQLGGGNEFDIYVTRDLEKGVGGYAGFSGFFEDTARADAFGYLVVAADLKPHVLRFVVAHEFFHGIQMSYDWWEDIAFMESSANWATELVYDDLNVYWKFIPFFQAEPFLALDYVSMKNPYQYGMMMWPMFLEERLGQRTGDILRRVWEGSVQNETENEPDFQDATLVIAKEQGINDFQQLLTEFSLWRLLVGEFGAFGHFKERGTWGPTVTPYLEFSGTVQDLPLNRDASHPLQPQSSAFIRLTRPNGEAASFELSFAQPTDFSIEVLSETSAGIESLGRSSYSGQQVAQIGLPLRQKSDQILLVISHFGAGPYDPDTSQWTPTPWHISLTSK